MGLGDILLIPVVWEIIDVLRAIYACTEEAGKGLSTLITPG